MTTSEVYSKTLAFGWIKLGLGVINILIDVVLFGILMGISLLMGSEGVAGIMLMVWIALVGVVNFVLNHYVGYLVKAGHVAVIATAFQTGQVPNDPVNTGKLMVKERFGTSNVYFAIDRLVAGSVKQLQRTLGRVTDTLFGAIPGMDSVKGLMNLFLDISLGYIDECCLGYTFNHKEQNAYKSAADGVVIYAQNWKTLLKDSAKTTFTVILSVVVVTLIGFILFGGIFRLLGWSGLVAFVIALLFAWTVKYAFIDSWILVKMMSSYMTAAQTTVITFDLYGKLSNLSAKFRELFKKGGSTAAPTQTAFQPAQAASPIQPAHAAPTTAQSQPTNAPKFCPACGKPLVAGKLFCGNCGAKL